MSNENNKNAAERISDLETVVPKIISALQPIDLMVKDIMNIKEAVKLLNNKLDAVVKNLNQGLALSDENLSKSMTDNNEEELKEKLASLVNAGILVATDTVSKTSFVVINETDKDGKMLNPRIQFLWSNVKDPTFAAKLEATKVGGSFETMEGGSIVNVLEAYEPAAAPEAENEAGEQAQVEASAPEPSQEAAPAAEIAPAAALDSGEEASSAAVSNDAPEASVAATA